MYFCELRLQRIDLPLYGRNVDFGLLFEGVHIARNVEVVVVIGKLLASGDISITLLDDTLCEFALCKAAVGRNDGILMVLGQFMAGSNSMSRLPPSVTPISRRS